MTIQAMVEATMKRWLIARGLQSISRKEVSKDEGCLYKREKR